MQSSAIRTALIVNQRSRQAKRDPRLIDILKEAYANRGPILDCGDELELLQFLQQCRKEEVDLIFICGGDGTLRFILDCAVLIFEDELPKIGILRGGTMNVVASSLGIKGKPKKTLQRYLNQIDRGQMPRVEKRRLLRVNDKNGFIWVVGGFSNFLDAYYSKTSPTPLWALILIFRVWLSRLFMGRFFRDLFSAFSVEIEVEGGNVETQSLLSISAASIEEIGFGFRPYLTSLKTKSFGYFGLSSFPRLLPFYFLPLLVGEKLTHSSILQGSCKSLRLRFERPLKPFLDGDPLEPAVEFHLSLGVKVECVIP